MNNYESPVKITEKLVSEVIEKSKNDIIAKAKVEYGIEIDGEELIRVLAYDRHQFVKGYEDGYIDGYHDAKEKFKNLLDDTFAAAIKNAVDKWDSEEKGENEWI